MSRVAKKLEASTWFRSDRYINREFSWLQFNRRVLEEAANPKNPLLERLKFLAIFESNLDEVYMVRVSGLIEQFEGGVLEESPDGLTPNQQLLLISQNALPLRLQAAKVWEQQIRPQLHKAGVNLLEYVVLSDKQKSKLRAYFRREVFPLCTPLIMQPSPALPFISNRSLNLAVELSDPATGNKLARVKLPTILARAVRINPRKHDYVLLEDIIRNNLQELFPGVDIVAAHLFRVIRDADVEIRELEAADLVATVEQTIKLRRFGDPVLLEIDSTMPIEVRETLMSGLDLEEDDVFQVDGILGMDVFWEFYKIDKPSLRYPPYLPHLNESLANGKALFETISAGDILLHHPFDSFRPVEEFVASAAKISEVIGIKQTLYRVGTESPIVESLLDAAEEGKQVAVMVELKARFDESNNLVWARALERAGVHVTYGFPEMKTHCKLCLIVRREPGGVKSYAHIGTGNYNPNTARSYTDLGVFTCDTSITQDISELFNFLTGFSRQTDFRKLLVAPLNLREGILERIQREIKCFKRTGKGRIIFKLNSLVDPEVIEALYEASIAGLKVDLIVRGICCLRPGVGGMSKSIRVVSIVGRFLEHSRVYYFENGGAPEALIGSADLMRRNLDRRIEVLLPIENRETVEHLRTYALDPYLIDNQNAWELNSEGAYKRLRANASQKPFDAQRFLMANPTTKLLA